MADNPFDQFDPAPREATSASNPFDQFDSKQPTVSAPARLPGGLDEQGFPVPGGTGGHEPSPAPSRLERVGRELASPVLGAAQLAAHILPLPAYQDGKWTNAASATDATVAANEARIEEARGGAKGVNWERVGLDFVNPGNYAGAGLGLEGRGAAAAMGALGAVTQPVTGEGGYWTGKAGQAAAGAAAGRAGEAVARGVGAVIAPEMERGARALTDAGARLTPGQMVGGTGKRAEDALSSVPVVGTLIRSAQVTSLEDFNRAALNQGLEHIGVQVPQTVEAGRPALNYARDAIKAAYNDVVPRMVGQKDPTFVSEINNIRALGENLPPETRAELNRVIDHDVMGRFSEGGGMTGEQAQEIGTTLDNLADRLRVSEFPDRRRLSGAIREIDATINRMMERNNPTLSLEKARIDLANAHYKTMEAASGMLGAKDGLVLPAQLSHAIKSRDGSKDKSDYARGFALMQDFAANAERTLNRQLPDSGTPERLFWRELTKELAVIGGLAGGAHAAGTPSQDILAASAGLGLAALPYTEPGLAAARALANPGAGRKAVRQGLEGIAPYLAPGAGAAAAGLGVGP